MFYITEQDKFEHHIKKNDLKEVTIRLNHPDVNVARSDNHALGLAAQYGHIDILKLLLKDKRVDPSGDNNWAIRFASENGKYESVKLLLKDKRVDPSACSNDAISYALKRKHLVIVDLLWSDKRVKRTLKKDYPKIYEQLIPMDIIDKLNNFNKIKKFNNEYKR